MSHHLSTKQIFTGRVFSRLNQYHALPQELKHEVASLESHLTTIQNEVFAKHHTLQLKSVRGVRYKSLLETVYAWVLEQESPTPGSAADDAVPVAARSDAVPKSDVATAPAATTEPELTATSTGAPGPSTTTQLTPAVITEEVSATRDEEAEAKRAAEEATKSARVSHAKKLIDAMVLKGFITPNKEDKSVAPTAHEEFAFKDLDLLVPLATAITGLTIPTTTVWDLVDGTVFAAPLKRRAGLLAPLTSGKDVYVLVNVRAHSVTLFESDVAREPIRIFEAAQTSVTHDKTHYDHGVKLWDETDAELFNTASVSERDAFVAALEAVGVTFREQFPIPDHHAKPVNVNPSYSYTVEELTEAAADAVPLDDEETSDAFKTHVPVRTEANETAPTNGREETATNTDTIAENNERVQASETPRNAGSHEPAAVMTDATLARDHGTGEPSQMMTPDTMPTHDVDTRDPTTTQHEQEVVPSRPRTQSVDYGKPVDAPRGATTTTAPKHDETSTSSPTESSSSTASHDRFGGDVADLKADKLFRFDEPTTTTRANQAPTSNYFCHWTNTANPNTMETSKRESEQAP